MVTEKIAKSRKQSQLEMLMESQLLGADVEPWVVEYAFIPWARQWRFDFAWPSKKVALEVEGGTMVAGGSRHTTALGFEMDCEKYNTAAVRGWRVLRVTGRHVKEGIALVWVQEIL
jgi:hypothetical protein